MSTGKKFGSPKSGAWVQPKHRGYKMACCDCGLVHTMNFKIVWNGKKVRFQVFRNNRSTAMMHRSMWGKDWLKKEKARRAKL